MGFPVLLFQWGATIYVGIVSFGLNVFVARSIGAEGFGEFATAMALGSILLIVLDGGFRTVLLREMTSPTPGMTMSSERIQSFALGHLFVVTFICGALTFVWFRANFSLALATLACFAGVAMTQLVSAQLRGRGRLIHDGAWQVIVRTLSAGAIVVLLLAGLRDAWLIAATWAAVGITLAVLALGRHLPAARWWFEWEIYRATLMILIIDFAAAVYFRFDLVLMAWLGTPKEDSGNYAVAYRLIEAVILLASPVGILLFRRFRGISAMGLSPVRVVGVPAGYALGLGTAIAIAIEFVAPVLVRWIYGPQYDSAVELLQVLCWALVFLMPNVVLTQAALAFDLERYYAVAAILAACVNLGLNIVFLQTYGVKAAACITVFTELVLFFLLALALWRSNLSD